MPESGIGKHIKFHLVYLIPGLVRDLNSDLVYKLMIGSSKNTGEIIRGHAFEHKKKKPGLNLTPG